MKRTGVSDATDEPKSKRARIDTDGERNNSTVSERIKVLPRVKDILLATLDDTRLTLTKSGSIWNPMVGDKIKSRWHVKGEGDQWFPGTIKYIAKQNVKDRYLIEYEDGEIQIERYDSGQWTLVEPCSSQDPDIQLERETSTEIVDAIVTICNTCENLGEEDIMHEEGSCPIGNQKKKEEISKLEAKYTEVSKSFEERKLAAHNLLHQPDGIYDGQKKSEVLIDEFAVYINQFIESMKGMWHRQRDLTKERNILITEIYRLNAIGINLSSKIKSLKES